MPKYEWLEYDLEKLTRNIIEGTATFSEVQENSKNYLGNRTYQYIDYYITAEGRAAGWIYEYPFLKFEGVPYKEAGQTIEAGIIRGHLALQNTHQTHCG